LPGLLTLLPEAAKRAQGPPAAEHREGRPEDPQRRELQQRALEHGETPEVLKRKELEAQLEERKARLGL
jgi:hypothetical protein